MSETPASRTYVNERINAFANVSAEATATMLGRERKTVQEALDRRDARISALETRLATIEKGGQPREFRARLKVKETA